MKCTAVITAILLLGSANAMAQNASDTDVLLGAAAGAALGSTIGQGDGKKIATVIGGLLGAEMARDAAENRDYRNESSRSTKYRTNPYFKKQRIIRYCERNIPIEYVDYPDAARAWVEGCVKRQNMLMLEIQNQAYEDGLYGRH
jgi:uncharacterized protein YcfJ